MSGDRDSPDREFACQSNPRTDCVIPASSSTSKVFSDMHFYYHGAGVETTYMGTIQIGFFEGSPDVHKVPVKITVKKAESITNQSVTDIVTSTPGAYAVTVDLVATVTGSATTKTIIDRIAVTVR